MKRLKISTIKRVLLKNSYSQPYNTGDYFHFYYLYSGHYYYNGVTLTFNPKEPLIWAKARLKNKGHVHINTCYRWPQTLKELDHIVKEVKEVYSELCSPM